MEKRADSSTPASPIPHSSSAPAALDSLNVALHEGNCKTMSKPPAANMGVFGSSMGGRWREFSILDSFFLTASKNRSAQLRGDKDWTAGDLSSLRLMRGSSMPSMLDDSRPRLLRPVSAAALRGMRSQ